MNPLPISVGAKKQNIIKNWEKNERENRFVLLDVLILITSMYTHVGRSGRSGQSEYGHRRLPLHAGGQQRADHAGIPGADDRFPVAALERLSQSHARAPVLPTGGGGPLLAPRPRRRHALANGPRLDRQRTGYTFFIFTFF